ncbi:nose resistant to fluoxetine protein 6-like [Oratosquilla oratoria]|uniref:nose resistant to fluoxetine protein 6-like n=1 Tax=Oratosquilla oratoria TaxID=337810 RepID=UPI003F75FF6B
MKTLLGQAFLLFFLHGYDAQMTRGESNTFGFDVETTELESKPLDDNWVSEPYDRINHPFIPNVSRFWLMAWLRNFELWPSMYLPSPESNRTSEACREDLKIMIQELQEGSLRTIQMLDAWGKVPDGLLWGNLNADGSYEECLSLRRNSTDGEVSLRGKYCSVTYRRPPKSGSLGEFSGATSRIGQVSGTGPGFTPLGFLTYGTCMPSSCTQEDLQESVADALEEGQLLGVGCHTDRDQPELLPGDTALIALLAVLLFLMLSSAVLDIFIDLSDKQNIRKGPARYFLAFSLSTNFRKIFHVSQESAPGTIACIHGIRVLSMYWVIYAHQHFYNIFFVGNIYAAYDRSKALLFQIILNGTISVDSFFFMSGLLVSYGVMRELQRTGRLNVIKLYIHRLIRLTPPIAMACALTATVLRFFAVGPRSTSMDSVAEMCRKYWWKDVLYVNNFLSYDESNVISDCIQPTWYTSADTQLFLVAPLLILPLHFRPSIGRGFLYLVTLASVLTPAIVTVVYDLTPTSLIFLGANESNHYMRYVYVVPWCRAGPWIVGIWTGYILFKQNKNRILLETWQVVTGWTVAVFVALAVLFGMYSYDDALHPMQYDVMTQFFYGGFHRTAWALALAWVVIACQNGYGGLVNSFLSYPAWQPLSRLTYTMFLMSVPIQQTLSYCLKTTIYLTYTNKILETCGTLFVTGIVSVFVSLSVESPILALEKLILKKRGSERPVDRRR